MVHPKRHAQLKRELCHVPITSLALHRAPSGKLYILAGEDSNLVVYEAGDKRRRFVSQTSVFQDQPIHGIHIQKDTVLVWGSRSVALLSLKETVKSSGEETAVPIVLARITAPDWIFHGAISPSDNNLAALATAHNEIVFLRYSSSTGKLTLSAPISPSRPMLFSAHLTWISEECILVAGGTVFGHVVVWKHHLGHSRDEEATASMQATETLFNFQGHEGSIFGVDISQPMQLPDGSLIRLLASCSDDRTIHIWNITDREGDERLGVPINQVIDTGFGTRQQRKDNSNNAASGNDPIAVAMGHASRIWGVKFGPLDGDGGITVYSFGEDSTMQRWLLKLSNNTVPLAEDGQEPQMISGALAHNRTISLHNGKHLWSNAMLIEKTAVSIVTGGGDSQICFMEEPILDTTHATAPHSGSHIILDVHDILRSVSSSLPSGEIPPAGRKEIISRYDFISHDQMVVTTSHGRLLLGSLQTGSYGQEWQQVEIADGSISADLQFCYILKNVGQDAAILGTTSGNLYHFHLPSQKISHLANLSGKIAEINLVSRESSLESNGSPVNVLVHLHGTADSYYITLSPSTGIVLSQEQIRGLDPRFKAISAANINDSLIIGSRHGWLSILDRDIKTGTYRPILDMATRSRDAITAILSLPRKSGAETISASPYILVTSRDGKYRIYEIDRQANAIRLHLRHEASPPFGPTIAGAWFTNDAVPELILYGFRSKDFIIWNETRREELATVECGGAHRTFQLAYSTSEPWRYRFAFTKASKLSISSTEKVPHRWIKTGTHGREIRALSYNGRFIATGAEDTSIRIWEYLPTQDRGRAETRCVATMKTHITGIQRLAWFEGDYLFSSAGNEEFFVWRIGKLESDYTGLAVFCEGVFTDKTEEGDLRIMDFDVSRVEHEGSILITMAFSNSTLKTYRYSSDEGLFEIFAQGEYTGACLTQVRHLSFDDASLCVLTASTDGHLALWRTEPSESKVHKFILNQAAPLHQNSIKGLDMTIVKGNCCVITGGDDNGVGVAIINQATNDAGKHDWTISRRSLVKRAHGAAVSGVAITQQSSGLVGVSVSNDQQVKAWSIPQDNDDSCIELLAVMDSGVADAGDVGIVNGQDASVATVLLGGVGIEAWKLLTKNQPYT